MKAFRLEEEKIQAIFKLDRVEVDDELARVAREIAKLTARTHHLENQRDRLYDRETKPVAGHTDNLGPGPREKFLSDTKDMYMSDADRELNTS